MTDQGHSRSASPSRSMSALLPLLAPVGAVGFTATWAVLGTISTGYQMWDIVVPSYSPVSQPVSGLGLGETAAAMNTSFLVCGALVTLGAWAATSTWTHAGSPRRGHLARALVSVSGIGMAICGLFTLESMMMHSLGFLLAIGAPAAGFVLAAAVTRRTDPALSRLMLLAGAGAAALLVIFLATFDPQSAGDNEGTAGLVQRVLITVVLGTIAAIGIRATGAPRTTHSSTDTTRTMNAPPAPTA